MYRAVRAHCAVIFAIAQLFLKMKLPCVCVRILESLSFSKTATAQRIGHGSFFYINMTQGSVATRLRRVDGIFNDHLNAIFFALCDSERISKICRSICRSFVLIIRVRGLLLWPTLFVSVTYIQTLDFDNQKKRKFGDNSLKVHGGLALTSF